MENIEGFQEYVWEAGLRWGSHKASEIIVLGDGAKGFQNRAENLYPDAIQILDWYHATEHLWNVAKTWYGTGTEKAKRWAKPLLDKLWEGKVDEVLIDLRRMKPRRSEVKKLLKELIPYYQRNRKRMRYAEFKEAGYFIGSGAVESGVKNVVNLRMKGCGMRWDNNRGDQLIHARARYLSMAVPFLKAA